MYHQLCNANSLLHKLLLHLRQLDLPVWALLLSDELFNYNFYTSHNILCVWVL